MRGLPSVGTDVTGTAGGAIAFKFRESLYDITGAGLAEDLDGGAVLAVTTVFGAGFAADLGAGAGVATAFAGVPFTAILAAGAAG